MVLPTREMARRQCPTASARAGESSNRTGARPMTDTVIMTSRGGRVSCDGGCYCHFGVCLLLLPLMLQQMGVSALLQVPSSVYPSSCTHAAAAPRSYHRRSSLTLLYTSTLSDQESEKNGRRGDDSSSILPTSGAGGTDDNEQKKKKKWPRNPLRNRFTLPTIQSTKRAILSFIKLLLNSPSSIKVYYSKLTRRGRLALSIQLLILGLALGMGINTSYRDNATKLAASRPVEVSYSTFLDLVAVNGKGHTPGKNPALLLDNVIISKDKIAFRIISDIEKHASAVRNKQLVQSNDVSTRPVPLVSRTIYTIKPYASDTLISTLHEHDVPFRAASTHTANTIATVTRLSIFAIYMLFLRRMYQTMSGGGSNSKNGEVPGKLATFNDNETSKIISFDDIEGIDNAKYEVMELVDTLCNPSKYEIMGARAPKGLLLEGPPGTGKTMLARATAATAGVPLLYCSGSDFVEMFVGRGAARVRNTFSRAAKLSPCIIFIDELDALGKSRDMGGFGSGMRSNDEAEQTLNQLLACMDGLDSTKRICVLAATNRKEILDPALIRPGRFDRIIKVTLPDVHGRERILRVHAKKLPGFTECKGIDEKRSGSLGMGASVDLSAVAAVTRGLCGADLEFIVNEAAIRAVRRVSAKLRSGEDPKSITPCVSAEDFEDSVVNFYEMRKPKGGVGDLLSNVLGKGFE